MSKRQLLSFIENLTEAELKEQLIDLYDRFKAVKEFYDFSFNPNEEKRFVEAKARISKEYFPEAGKKVRKRRSVAHKLITQLQTLEADPVQIADLMLFNLEVVQLYTAEHKIRQEVFYNSMLRSFSKSLNFIDTQFLLAEFNERITKIIDLAHEQEWPNAEGFALMKKGIIGRDSS